MFKIRCHGEITVPEAMVRNAESIRLQSYKVNTPTKFQRRDDVDGKFKRDLAFHLGYEAEQLDFVYFSVCKGAEPHVDQLDPAIFSPTTFVVPVVLPAGNSVIIAEEQREIVKLNHVYEFNHEKIHSMELEDTESGCVVLMIAVKN